MRKENKNGSHRRAARLLAILLLAVMIATSGGPAALPVAAASDTGGYRLPEAAATALSDTADYLYRTVKTPQVGSIGGEWAVLGLARSEKDIPEEYYQDYYAGVESYVKACGGVLHDKKYTEYSRLTVALTAIGKDPQNVAGYNLLTPLGDFDKTIWQGINGPIWALIALDSGNYPMPQNEGAATQATREKYVDEILRRQLPDGGFSLFGGSDAAEEADMTADPDITAMALQALAKYQDRADVKKATEEALACLSNMQDEKGGYSSWGSTNSESASQVIVALTELGIPLDDSRFVKNGNTTLDNLLTFYRKGQGFLHTAEGSGSNLMATEQAFYALVAAQRAAEGKDSLYRMSDAIQTGEGTDETSQAGAGLPGKHADVKARDLTAPGKTFGDISAHKNQPAIESLLARGIISGYEDGTFRPEATMTRAEYAAIVVNALGLTPKATEQFADVEATAWYAPYVGTASAYGIVSGTSATTFQPEGTITKQEAACMTANAAKLCGLDTEMTEAQARDVIAQFEDYVSSDSWARPALAFCYQEDILSQDDEKIEPLIAIKRCEIAEMLFRLLGEAKLLK